MRILIIDKQSQACQCLKERLETWRQISAFREAANGCEALHLLEQLQPEIFLLDVRMPTRPGLKAIRLFKAKYQTYLIIAISLNSALKTEAQAVGVDVFISKSDPPEMLMEILAKELWIKKSRERKHLKPISVLPPEVHLQSSLSASNTSKFRQETPIRKK